MEETTLVTPHKRHSFLGECRKTSPLESFHGAEFRDLNAIHSTDNPTYNSRCISAGEAVSVRRSALPVEYRLTPLPRRLNNGSCGGRSATNGRVPTRQWRRGVVILERCGKAELRSANSLGKRIDVESYASPLGSARLREWRGNRKLLLAA